MKFEWDEAKRKSNLRKHRLDFTDAKVVFSDAAFTFADDRFEYDEDRYILRSAYSEILSSLSPTLNEKK